MDDDESSDYAKIGPSLIVGIAVGDIVVRYIVSTIKDSLPNITRFIDGNLAAGADLIFVFSEDLDDDAYEYLTDHELVIHIPSRTAHDHWGGNRPARLNLRQNTNANLVRTLLAACPWATWLFHLDGDEILDIDTNALESLRPDMPAVRLSPLESVAAMTDDWAGYFKYPLTDSNLALLHSLGAIAEPTKRALFNGHVAGKVGIRPSLDYRLTLHAAKVGTDKIPTRSGKKLRMLHYDSLNADEFVRKWLVLTANEGVRQRSRRRTLRSAVEATTRLSHLSSERRAEILKEIYERNVADDVHLLAELGFLTRLDETRHGYEPRRHTREQLAAMHELLMLLKQEDLAVYSPRRALDEQRQALEKALARASARTAAMTTMPPEPGRRVN